MFVDEVKIRVQAGKGGDGSVHFRREKFVPRGGPDGGDGGNGGRVLARAKTNVHTLSDYRHQVLFKAPSGNPGESQHKHGRNGEDLYLDFPVGAIIREKSSGKVMADLAHSGQTVVLAIGGVGGKGNAGFVSSIRQVPRFAEKGDVGQEFDLEVELKLVADIAIIGQPSAGKSTLISVLSNARPKIADYPFTTLVPNLGVMKQYQHEVVLVDVPGLIEGASAGKGLGHKFLRHIERARALLHLVGADEADPVASVQTIREELSKFSQTLADKPWYLAVSKADLLLDSQREEFLAPLRKIAPQVFIFSAATRESLDDLKSELVRWTPVEVAPVAPHEDAAVSQELRPESPVENRSVRWEQTSGGWRLYNARLERMVRQTELSNPDACQRVYETIKRWRVLDKLKSAGIHDGDKIFIGEGTWEYWDNQRR